MALLKDHHIAVPANWLFDLYTGGGRRPVFFDLDATYPSLRQVDRGFRDIQEEVLAILPGRARIPRYHELDEAQKRISGEGETDRDWRIFMLYYVGLKPEKNRALCPRTCAILDRIPNLFQAFFSILDAGKSVPPHHGPYRGYIRYHLGLVVPSERTPTIRVKDQRYTWKEGESVLFDDSWEHEVFNDCPEVRVVLVVDVMRPMPRPFHALNSLIMRTYLERHRRSVAGKLETFESALTR